MKLPQDFGLITCLIIFGLIISGALSTGVSVSSNTGSKILSPAPVSVNYYNANSQKVANYLIANGWNSNIGMLTDPEKGCTDYVDAISCYENGWMTSDNIPTCSTLGDYGFSSQMQTCESTLASLGACSYNNGERYEAYVACPITIGNPGDQHTILQPINGTNHIVCANPPCPGHYYGTFANGTQYGLECDCWDGSGAGKPNPNAGVDIAAPQAINAWLYGNLPEFTLLENNLVARWNGTGVGIDGNCGAFSTWQLGQIMFVMRIGGLDNTSTFTAMENELWSLQNPLGYLPNCYNSTGPLAGHDTENQDAGLLPFSTSAISNVKNSFGIVNAGVTLTTTKTVLKTVTSTIAKTTITHTPTTTVHKTVTSTTLKTSTTCCATSTTIIPSTTVSTSTACCVIQTATITQTSTSCCAFSTQTVSTTQTQTGYVTLTDSTSTTLSTTQTQTATSTQTIPSTETICCQVQTQTQTVTSTDYSPTVTTTATQTACCVISTSSTTQTVSTTQSYSTTLYYTTTITTFTGTTVTFTSDTTQTSQTTETIPTTQTISTTATAHTTETSQVTSATTETASTTQTVTATSTPTVTSTTTEPTTIVTTVTTGCVPTQTATINDTTTTATYTAC